MIETLAVCVTVLVGLQLVLRFIERRDTAKAVTVNAGVADELAKKLKAAEDRLSKLEMGRAFTGR